ncbi:MAG TPA: cellulase family glycosylhydrolase [Pseudolysinimonas sp.]|nr:cellulase family glycosylhydrolase [Pseudolysinimonas sp.]
MARVRALVVAAIAVALVLTGIAPALPASAAVSRELAIQQILADTNALRAQVGLQPLRRNTALDAVAQNWTQHQADTGTMAHNPNLSAQIPPGYNWRGENVAMGYSYKLVVAAWRASPGHYANIVRSEYTDIGIGYVEKNGTAWYTQDFVQYSRPGPAAPVPSPTPDAAPVPQVSGNTIVDARTGRVWVPHGVNWPSFEYACQQGWDYTQGGATDAAAAAMRGWGIDLVRLPLNEQCWMGWESNPHYGTVTGYRQAVRAFVDILNAHGIVVVLDLHWSAPPGQQADGQRAMATTRSVLFWQSVAAAFAKVPSVIFDAFNEPYSRGSFTLSWSCWKSGGCRAPDENDTTATSGQTFTVAGMQAIVTAIRKAGAKQPIMLAGLDYANDLRGWLANRPSDGQLIASWHNYPGQRCQTLTCWNAEIAPVAAQVPVITSEFGMTRADTDTMTPFMTWADAHGIGYAPWAWWVVDASESPSAALYALITDDETFAPKEPEGTLYSAHLASLAGPAVAPPPPGRTGPSPVPTGTPAPRPPAATPTPEPRDPASTSGAAALAPSSESTPTPAPAPEPELKVGLWLPPRRMG